MLLFYKTRFSGEDICKSNPGKRKSDKKISTDIVNKPLVFSNARSMVLKVNILIYKCTTVIQVLKILLQVIRKLLQNEKLSSNFNKIQVLQEKT